MWCPTVWFELVMMRPVKQSWDMLDLKYVFIGFNFDKLLSASTTVTGRVRAIDWPFWELATHSDRFLKALFYGWMSAAQADSWTLMVGQQSSSRPAKALCHQCLHSWKVKCLTFFVQLFMWNFVNPREVNTSVGRQPMCKIFHVWKLSQDQWQHRKAPHLTSSLCHSLNCHIFHSVCVCGHTGAPNLAWGGKGQIQVFIWNIAE